MKRKRITVTKDMNGGFKVFVDGKVKGVGKFKKTMVEVLDWELTMEGASPGQAPVETGEAERLKWTQKNEKALLKDIWEFVDRVIRGESGPWIA